MSLDTFDNLAAEIVDYGKAPRLLDKTKTTFIPLANIRIGRDLRSPWNETSVVISTALAGTYVPALDLAAVKAITVESASSGECHLKARSLESLQDMPTTGADPEYYSMRGTAILTRPATTKDITAYYWTAPDLSAASPTDFVLTYYPQLYLYAGLIELFSWQMDEAQRDMAMRFFIEEVQQSNRAARRWQGPAQAIGRV